MSIVPVLDRRFVFDIMIFSLCPACLVMSRFDIFTRGIQCLKDVCECGFNEIYENNTTKSTRCLSQFVFS